MYSWPQRVRYPTYEAANRFLHYIAEGLATGTIKYNDSDSAIHFISEGMLLITPKIFSLFTGVKFDRTNPNCPGKKIQKQFEALKIHELNSAKSAHWSIRNREKDSGKPIFQAYLIPEKNLYRLIQNSSRPANNPHLALFEIS